MKELERDVNSKSTQPKLTQIIQLYRDKNIVIFMFKSYFSAQFKRVHHS